MNSISPASPTSAADAAVGAACAARRARLLGIIEQMEDTAVGLMQAFAAQAHAEMAAAQAAREAAAIGELLPQGAGVRSGMACDRMGRMLRLAILLEERVAEGTAGRTAPAAARNPSVTRAAVTPERLDAIDAPERLDADERIERLETEVLRGDRSVEDYLVEMLGEMEREMRDAGFSEAEIEEQLGAARAAIEAVPSGDAAGAGGDAEPAFEDAAPEGARVRDPPNRGPPAS